MSATTTLKGSKYEDMLNDAWESGEIGPDTSFAAVLTVVPALNEIKKKSSLKSFFYRWMKEKRQVLNKNKDLPKPINFLSPTGSGVARLPSIDHYSNPPIPPLLHGTSNSLVSPHDDDDYAPPIMPTIGVGKSTNCLTWQPQCVMGLYSDAQMNQFMFVTFVP